jgi:hypothetical protein
MLEVAEPIERKPLEENQRNYLSTIVPECVACESSMRVRRSFKNESSVCLITEAPANFGMADRAAMCRVGQRLGYIWCEGVDSLVLSASEYAAAGVAL